MQTAHAGDRHAATALLPAEPRYEIAAVGARIGVSVA
jgi:hypothetical protein